MRFQNNQVNTEWLSNEFESTEFEIVQLYIIFLCESIINLGIKLCLTTCCLLHRKFNTWKLNSSKNKKWSTPYHRKSITGQGFCKTDYRHTGRDRQSYFDPLQCRRWLTSLRDETPWKKLCREQICWATTPGMIVSAWKKWHTLSLLIQGSCICRNKDWGHVVQAPCLWDGICDQSYFVSQSHIHMGYDLNHKHDQLPWLHN